MLRALNYMKKIFRHRPEWIVTFRCFHTFFSHFLNILSWNELYVHYFIDWVKNKPPKDNCREIWTYFKSCKHLSSQAHIVTFFYIVCSHIMVYTKWLMNLILSIFSGQFGMRVKRCFSFSDTNNTVQLVDDNGWVVLHYAPETFKMCS